MQKTAVYAELTLIFRDVFMRDDIQLRPWFTADGIPAWDSFRHIEIIVAVERRYGIKFKSGY